MLASSRLARGSAGRDLALAHALVVRQVDRALVVDLAVAADEAQVDRAVAGEALAHLAEELLAHAQRQDLQAQAWPVHADQAQASSCVAVLCRPKLANTARLPPLTIQRTMSRVCGFSAGLISSERHVEAVEARELDLLAQELQVGPEG
jgi:hypothetical protein